MAEEVATLTTEHLRFTEFRVKGGGVIHINPKFIESISVDQAGDTVIRTGTGEDHVLDDGVPDVIRVLNDRRERPRR